MCCHSLFGVQRTDDPPAATPVLLLETGNTSQAHDITADWHHWSSQTRWYLQHGSVCLLRCELRPPHWLLKSGRTRHRFMYARSFPRWVFFRTLSGQVHVKSMASSDLEKFRKNDNFFFITSIVAGWDQSLLRGIDHCILVQWQAQCQIPTKTSAAVSPERRLTRAVKPHTEPHYLTIMSTESANKLMHQISSYSFKCSNSSSYKRLTCTEPPQTLQA